jgi:DNA processing protein
VTWDDAERAYLVALLRARPNGLNWPRIAAEVAETGSAQRIWEKYSPAQLFADESDDYQSILEAAEEDVKDWRREKFRFLTFLDMEYPPRLRDVHQVPPVLFTRGKLENAEIGVSIVGSRTASPHGLDFAEQVARALVARKITIISGLAAGIDTAAHTAALAANGRTVAVIGTGISQYYPASNRRLQDNIAERGLVMSQFWPNSPPTKQSFPIRNATMSAYGYATVVIEASEKSGARTQARLAIEHGRPVILSYIVAQGTGWGRAMIGKPGVFVADNPGRTVELVEEVLARSTKVSQLLSSLGQ